MQELRVSITDFNTKIDGLGEMVEMLRRSKTE
jgi:hypothetical protein